jgi:hypothetical protein
MMIGDGSRQKVREKKKEEKGKEKGEEGTFVIY